MNQTRWLSGSRVLQWASERTVCPNLGLARIGIAIGLILTLAEIGPLLFALASPDRVRAPRFEGVPALTPTVAAGLALSWAAGATALLVGWRSRAGGTLVVLCLTCVLALDEQLYSNHLYLLLCLTLLVTLSEADAYFSVAARGRDRPRAVPVWPVLLMKVQLSIVYLFAALTKLNMAFLSGGMLAVSLREGLLPFPDALRRVEVLAPLAWLAVLLEAYLAFALWSSSRRRTAVWLGVLLHVGITLTIGDTLGLAAFSVAMLALYPLFFRTPAAFLRAFSAPGLRWSTSRLMRSGEEQRA